MHSIPQANPNSLNLNLILPSFAVALAQARPKKKGRKKIAALSISQNFLIQFSKRFSQTRQHLVLTQ